MLHYHTCNLCEAMCGLALDVEGGRVRSVRGDKDDVLSRGHICPKAPALVEVYEDPDRLRTPLRRTSAGFVPISWDEALQEASERLLAIRAAHGRDALGIYVGNPTVHSHSTTIAVQGLMRGLRTRNRFDANSQDANPKLLISTLMYGDPVSITVPDVDRVDFLLMLGANPAASGGSLMSLGDVRGRMQAIRARGGRIVVIDPRRTETCAWADEHHFIRPGGDAALCMALIHELITSGRVDAARVDDIAVGLPALAALAGDFTPERVAERIGMTPETIRHLAHAFAAAPRAVAYGRVGTCQNPFGALATWLIEALNIITLNFDRPGGAMFATPAADVAVLGKRLLGNQYARWRSRVRGLPEVGGQLPACVMAEEMETPGKGQIRGFLCVAGNPVLSTPNGPRLARALAGLEFMVAIDYYRNETTRFAHLILPPLHALERGHYDLVFHALAVRNTAKYSAPVLPRAPDGREDWEILYELGMRLGGLRLGVPFIDRALHLGWRMGIKLSPDRVLDLLIRLGPYGDRFVPGKRGLNLDKVRAAPHGLDLGPLIPARERKVRLPQARVALVPDVLAGDVPRLGSWLAEPPADLVLIGRRHLRSNNSWLHNSRLLTKGSSRSALLMHPDDASARGLRSGMTVAVQSRVGAVSVKLQISDSVMRGVVSLPHGFGHQEVKDSLRIAGTVAGANANALTDELLVDPISGTAALSGVPVAVSAAPSEHEAAPGNP